MGRPFKAQLLTPAQHDRIAAMRGAGRPVDEILAELEASGLAKGALGRTTLNRYILHMEALQGRLAGNRMVAEALVERLGKTPESQTGRLAIELMYSVLTELMVTAEGGPDPDTLHVLAKSLGLLTRAAKTDADLTLEVRRALEAEQKAKLERLGRRGVKDPGFDAETLRRIRTEIYGLPE